MRVLAGGLDKWDSLSAPTAVTLGVFDGVHVGHRRLIERAFEHDGTPTVVTFDPHPVEILTDGIAPRLITTLDERLVLLEGVGAEIVAVLDLGEIRDLEPAQFVQMILVDRLKTSSLTIGEDFHFGRNRAGGVPFLVGSGEKAGFTVDPVDLVAVDGQLVSSSQIRDFIEQGAVEDAAALLGSRYRMTNRVTEGERRGGAMGFPTANLRPVPRKVLPADGVYATVASVVGESHAAAVNVGTRPTFGGGERLVEAFLLDFDGDIYDEDLTLEFVARLRPELAFDNVGDLVAHMADDVEKTRHIVGSVMG